MRYLKIKKKKDAVKKIPDNIGGVVWRAGTSEPFLLRAYSFQKEAAPSAFGSMTPVRLDWNLENKSPI